MKNRYRWSLLILFLSAYCLSSRIAQSQVPTVPSDITARLTALKEPEKNIPENQIELSDELRRIDDELAHRRADVADFDAANKELEALKNSAATVFQDIDALKCDQVSGPLPAAASLGEVASSVLKLTPVSTEANPWAAISLGNNSKLSPKDQCQKLKEAIGDADKRQSLLGFIDNKRKEYEGTKNQLNSLIEALQKRRGALLQHVSAGTAQTKVGNDLWLIILVIGVLSVGTIVAIRFFSPEIQTEWVSSGQVIQFVTVMILLTVIMALGLAGILKENTLGTLLGGIGGYVLSQGVGRAAGRAAAEAVNRGLTAGGAAAPTPPQLTSIAPMTGPSGGGTLVTITGTGFAAGATVTFGGTSAQVTNMTQTSIEVTTPAHAAGAVEVVVTNPGGQNHNLPNAFTYQ